MEKSPKSINGPIITISVGLTVVALTLMTMSSGHQHHHHQYHHHHGLQRVLAWKQLEYDFEGELYTKSSKCARQSSRGANSTAPCLDDDPNSKPEASQFFIQYNNVPIGLEIYKDIVFVTVPRRRYGIPSTLNYVTLRSGGPPLLKPWPSTEAAGRFVSIYRPRIDACNRLWAVDTGLIEVPGARRQVQPPAVLVWQVDSGQQLLRYELPSDVLRGERAPGGLTSITVEAPGGDCGAAVAYLPELASGALIVFSLHSMRAWRIEHSSFQFDETALPFNVAGHSIDWKDGIFSVAVVNGDAACDHAGADRVYYHALASTCEYSVDTAVLRSNASLEGHVQLVGCAGPGWQSGSHAYHPASNVVLQAGVARDALLCWLPPPTGSHSVMDSWHIHTLAQDHDKLVYISDLKVVGDEVWLLVNQMPRFVYSSLDPNEINFFIYKGNITSLIAGTPCDRRTHTHPH